MESGRSSSLPNPYASTFKSSVLEIPPGVDIIKWVGNFAQSTKVSVTILGGFGLLSEVAICPVSQLSPINIFENLMLLSLSGFFYMSETFVSCSYAATLARMDGTVTGGQVSRLVTMAPVVLTIVTSSDTKFVGGNSRILARL